MARNLHRFEILSYFFATLAVLSLYSLANAQRIAIFEPETPTGNGRNAELISRQLDSTFDLIDPDLSFTAYKAVAPLSPFNMTLSEAKTVGSTIGCDYFILVREKATRRASFKSSDNYEAYAVVYVVSSRTGRLIFWKLVTAEDPSETIAKLELDKLIVPLTNEIRSRIAEAKTRELPESGQRNENVINLSIETPDDFSKSPVPFNRFKPEYTILASNYGISATVEVEVSLDANGRVVSTEVVRWAGYGLDDSALEVVDRMQWRAGEKNGRFVPTRFLLRYNFKEIDK